MPIIFRCTAFEVVGNKVKTDTSQGEQMIREFRKVVDVSRAQCAVESDRVRELNIIGPQRLPFMNSTIIKAMVAGEISMIYSSFNVDAFQCGETEALVNAPDEPLEMSRDLVTAAIFGNLAAVGEILVKSKFNIDLSEALCGASIAGRTAVVELLLTIGVLFDEPKMADFSPAIGYAASNGHLDTVKLLASRGASTRICDRYGFTPLHKAATSKKDETVDLLIELGSDLNVYSLVMISLIIFDIKFLFFIKGVQESITLIESAIKYGTVSSVRSLIKAGIDVNFRLPVKVSIQKYNIMHGSYVALYCAERAECSMVAS